MQTAIIAGSTPEPRPAGRAPAAEPRPAAAPFSLEETPARAAEGRVPPRRRGEGEPVEEPAADPSAAPQPGVPPGEPAMEGAAIPSGEPPAASRRDVGREAPEATGRGRADAPTGVSSVPGREAFGDAARVEGERAAPAEAPAEAPARERGDEGPRAAAQVVGRVAARDVAPDRAPARRPDGEPTAAGMRAVPADDAAPARAAVRGPDGEPRPEGAGAARGGATSDPSIPPPAAVGDGAIPTAPGADRTAPAEAAALDPSAAASREVHPPTGSDGGPRSAEAAGAAPPQAPPAVPSSSPTPGAAAPSGAPGSTPGPDRRAVEPGPSAEARSGGREAASGPSAAAGGEVAPGSALATPAPARADPSPRRDARTRSEAAPAEAPPPRVPARGSSAHATTAPPKPAAGPAAAAAESPPPTLDPMAPPGDAPADAEPASLGDRSVPRGEVQRAAQLPVQVPPAQVARQIAEAVPGRPGGPVELHLDPRELGSVRITLHSVDGALSALVVADRPETAELMRRHADVLEAALREAGGRSVSVDVSGGGQGSDREERPRGGAPAAIPTEASIRAPAVRAASRGLDLRL